MIGARGFTLVELLLSVAIISVLVGLSVPVYESFARNNDLDIATQLVASSLRRAQTYARGSNTNNDWSVEVQSSTVTLFQGTNFGGRTQAYDETVSLPASVTPSGLTEVQFNKFSGSPNTTGFTGSPNPTGTITLTSTTNSTRTITINVKGMVDY